MFVTEDSAETRNLMRLAFTPGIGPRTLGRLLERFGTATAILDASREALAEVSGVGAKTIAAVRTSDAYVDVPGIVHWCEEHGVEVLIRGQRDYPEALATLDEAPAILFSKGHLRAEDQLAVAIVGARHATQYGLNQAGRFGRELARAGVTIISGMARGIDAAAHRGALEVGGRTIAVLGGGLGKIYPPEHHELYHQIADNGAVLSEQPPDVSPRGPMFPQRNRLISGLALGVLVIEASDRSGSLITARHAGEQGREVFALPGPVTSRMSRGCHQLIRDGAQLVSSPEQVLECLGPTVAPIPTDDGHQLRSPGELLLNEQERAVLEAIPAEGTSIDQVTRQSGLPVHRVLATISVLEMRHLIRRLSGQFVSRI